MAVYDSFPLPFLDFLQSIISETSGATTAEDRLWKLQLSLVSHMLLFLGDSSDVSGASLCWRDQDPLTLHRNQHLHDPRKGLMVVEKMASKI